MNKDISWGIVLGVGISGTIPAFLVTLGYFEMGQVWPIMNIIRLALFVFVLLWGFRETR